MEELLWELELNSGIKWSQIKHNVKKTFGRQECYIGSIMSFNSPTPSLFIYRSSHSCHEAHIKAAEP